MKRGRLSEPTVVQAKKSKLEEDSEASGSPEAADAVSAGNEDVQAVGTKASETSDEANDARPSPAADVLSAETSTQPRSEVEGLESTGDGSNAASEDRTGDTVDGAVEELTGPAADEADGPDGEADESAGGGASKAADGVVVRNAEADTAATTACDHETTGDAAAKETVETDADREPVVRKSEAAVPVTQKTTSAQQTPGSLFSASKPSSFSSFSGFSQFSSFKTSSSFGDTTTAKPWAKESAPSDKIGARKEEDNHVADFAITEKEHKTGEEGEKTVYNCHVRLFFIDLDSETKQWKERGTGQLRLNRSQDRNSTKVRYRLVMRTDGVLRVQLNFPLVKNTQVFKGFTNSLHSEKYLRLAGVENDRACQFALKCRSEEQRNALLSEIELAMEST